MAKKASRQISSPASKAAQPITIEQVAKVAKLASIPVAQSQLESLKDAFVETLGVVTNLQQVDVSAVEPTHQVTGLENVWREDVIRPELSFTQSQAVANAKRQHEGYFVVPQIIDQGD